jgi:putative ABC transport system ATP-binding protein
MAHVEVRDLVVEYRNGSYSTKPLDGLQLTADKGSLVLLLGPSGCGKTTLLSCLGGILSPTSGTVQVGGTDVGALDRGALLHYRRHEVGIVFQAFNLVPSLSALENVMLPLTGAGVSTKAARARATELLERVGLGERMSHRPGALSGGQQQRVAIARAFAHDPKLVLADEPTAHLDYVQVEGVLRVLRSMADDGRVVIVSTHDDRMLPIADQLHEMQPRFLAHRHQEPEEIVLPAGTVLFRQGERGDLLYLIQSGRMRMERERSEGGVAVLAVLEAGDHFGEMAPLFDLPRSATAVADVDTVLTSYTIDAFKQQFGLERLGSVLGRRAAADGGAAAS